MFATKQDEPDQKPDSRNWSISKREKSRKTLFSTVTDTSLITSGRQPFEKTSVNVYEKKKCIDLGKKTAISQTNLGLIEVAVDAHAF